jgi:hypothetical protein
MEIFMYSNQGIMISSHPLVAIIFAMLGICIAALAATSWKDRRQAQRSQAHRKLASRSQRATKKA